MVREEREARAALRRHERDERDRAARKARAWRRALKAAIAATKTKDCRCELRLGMSHDDLRALGSGCTTAKYYVCPRLDRVRQRMAKVAR